MRLSSSTRTLFLVWILTVTASSASARVGLLVGEPFGAFGTMMPVGHASIYVENLCAETPTQLRPCRPGEPGAVISRYHDLKTTHLDWLAFPLPIFLYGVPTPADAPGFITPAIEQQLRNQYREANLLAAVPDRTDAHGQSLPPRYGDWAEGIGAAFDRRLFLYTLNSTPAQDAAILALLTTQPNHRRYTLRRNNCADFAAQLLDLVLSAPLPRNKLGDFDLMTPKQLARGLEAYGQAHPEASLHAYVIPQLPGSLRRSRPLRGSSETFVKTKRYVAALVVLQPEALLLNWIDYEAFDKWKPGCNARPLTPQTLAALDTASPSTL